MNALNKDRSRWYGIRIGDVVTYDVLPRSKEYTVVELSGLDNNKITIEEGSTRFEAVPEHCTIVKKVLDYTDTELTDEERKEGWKIERCHGNTHKRGCGKSFKSLSWFEPSGCPHCNATFVD